MKSTGSTSSTPPVSAWASKTEIARFAEPFLSCEHHVPVPLGAGVTSSALFPLQTTEPTTGRSWRCHILLWPIRQLAKPWPGLPLLAVIAVAMAGCASMTQDVDAYYRQMAYNYKEAEEKAKMDELSLESQAKVLATTGEFKRQKRVQRELDRVKAWEEKCEKQAGRFEKAAEWTEAHFHLEPPCDSRRSARHREVGRRVRAPGIRSEEPLRISPGSKRGQAPLCEAPFGPFRQRSQTPF